MISQKDFEIAGTRKEPKSQNKAKSQEIIEY